jgi:hypothetical protein
LGRGALSIEGVYSPFYLLGLGVVEDVFILGRPHVEMETIVEERGVHNSYIFFLLEGDHLHFLQGIDIEYDTPLGFTVVPVLLLRFHEEIVDEIATVGDVELGIQGKPMETILFDGHRIHSLVESVEGDRVARIPVGILCLVVLECHRLLEDDFV